MQLYLYGTSPKEDPRLFLTHLFVETPKGYEKLVNSLKCKYPHKCPSGLGSLNGPFPSPTQSHTRLTLRRSETAFTPYCNVPHFICACFLFYDFIWAFPCFRRWLKHARKAPPCARTRCLWLISWLEQMKHTQRQQQVDPLSLQTAFFPPQWRKRGANMATCCL